MWSLAAKMKIFVNPSKKLLKNRTETFPVVLYFRWKLELVLVTDGSFRYIFQKESEVNSPYSEVAVWKL